jgi:NAD+ kinase
MANKDGAFREKKVLLVYKHSRLDYASERATDQEKKNIINSNCEYILDMKNAHLENLRCIKKVEEFLKKLNWDYRILCRSEVKQTDVKDHFIISIGGDGTLLDISHYCDEEPLLAINSDPQRSVGALCAADINTFPKLIKDIYEDKLAPLTISRLVIHKNKKEYPIKALNDILFCHKNPAALTRFIMKIKNKSFVIKSSGIWLSSAAGSTGAIYSAGADTLAMESRKALYCFRELYSSQGDHPETWAPIEEGETIHLESIMNDAAIYIDGPHSHIDIAFGETITISLHKKTLNLFGSDALKKARTSLIESRQRYRNSLYA